MGFCNFTMSFVISLSIGSKWVLFTLPYFINVLRPLFEIDLFRTSVCRECQYRSWFKFTGTRISILIN